MAEAAVMVLIGTAGCLHDAVHRQKSAYDQLSHVPILQQLRSCLD
jgi:hypothetical protein